MNCDKTREIREREEKQQSKNEMDVDHGNDLLHGCPSSSKRNKP